MAAFRDMVPLQYRLTYDRKEFAAITGCSLELVDKWIYAGIPVIREGRRLVFEKESAITWLRKRAIHREGMKRKKIIEDEIFPGIELA